MNYPLLIRSNPLHGRWAEGRPLPTSLSNPGWGGGVVVAEARRRRRKEYGWRVEDTTAAEAARRRQTGRSRERRGGDRSVSGYSEVQKNYSDVSPCGPTRQDATVKSATVLHSPTGPTRQS